MKIDNKAIALDASAVRENYALHMASLGFKIIPLRPGSKEPADSGWPALATTSREQIRSWFASRVNMNYGVVCGEPGLIVVDLDIKFEIDGIKNWNNAVSKIEVPKTFEVFTPSGGKHLYFRGSNVRNSVGKVAPGVDLRGEGGYVVGPGSVVPSGTYSLGLPWYFPDQGEIATASDQLMDLLKSRRASESFELSQVHTAPEVPVSKQPSKDQFLKMGRSVFKLVKALPGTRNETLNQTAFIWGSLVREGVLTLDEATRNILAIALKVGLSESESLGTIRSGLKSGIERYDVPLNSDSKYEALDLAAWLNGDHPEPTLFGSGNVLYRPALIAIMGEPASGKSFLCLNWALDVMKTGQNVVWLDEEAGPRDTIAKLINLNADTTILEKHFKYLKPETRNLIVEAEEFRLFVQQNAPGLVVVDSAAAVLANSGVNENDNSPVGAFMNKVLLPLVKDLEIPTLIIDHKTKNSPGSDYARGAGSKLGVADLALNVEVKRSFNKDQSGEIRVKINKDRTGMHLKDSFWPVEMKVLAGQVSVCFGELQVQASKPAKYQADIKAEVMLFIRSNPNASKAQIEKGIRGSGTEKKRQTLLELVESGELIETVEGNRYSYRVAPGSTVT